MKLSDLNRFSIEAQPHDTGRMNVSLFVLDDERVDGGNQRALSMISITSSGKDETSATENGVKRALSKLKQLQPLADIVKLGVMALSEANNEFSCTVQLGLFDKATEGADLIKKKTLGFGKGKDAETAEDNAIKSALKLIGAKS